VTCGRRRNAYGGQHFAGFEGGEICALIKLARGNPPSTGLAADVIRRAEAHHHGRHVISGISVGDVATERAEIADLRVSDLQRGLAKERDFRNFIIGMRLWPPASARPLSPSSAKSVTAS
jgi:hypothetical protein